MANTKEQTICSNTCQTPADIEIQGTPYCYRCAEAVLRTHIINLDIEAKVLDKTSDRYRFIQVNRIPQYLDILLQVQDRISRQNQA